MNLAVNNGVMSIENALERHFEPETVDDIEFDNGAATVKLKATQRSFISNAPEVLVFNLLRSGFDESSNTSFKINRRCKFPLVLDMKSYIGIGGTDPILYELHGILVHTGTAESGHYFSLIKEREANGQWHRYDDDKVTPWNHELNMDAECFGAESAESGNGTNAVLLFYDKKVVAELLFFFKGICFLLSIHLLFSM